MSSTDALSPTAGSIVQTLRRGLAFKKDRDIRVKIVFQTHSWLEQAAGSNTLSQWRTVRSEHQRVYESPQRLSEGAQTKEPMHNPSELTEQLM